MGDASDVENTMKQEECEKRIALENEGSFGGPTFCPPLYRQRYSTVLSVLQENKITKVADFGCAEGKFLVLLRELQSLQNIYGVDIDKSVLAGSTFKIEPRAADFLWARDVELTIQLLCGSLVDYDARLKDLDAVTMIELIEHLDPEPLRSFPANIFGRLQPRLVIVTTPNSEFNVLFPNFSGLRHYDHRFEWTRKEFEEWCRKICSQYNYQVELSGIGNAPEGSGDVGCCSQMAVFKRQTDKDLQTESMKEKTSDVTCGEANELCYELIAKSTFKGKPKISIEEEILLEAKYCINVLLYQEMERRGGRWDSYSDCDSQSSTPVDASSDCDIQQISLDFKATSSSQESGTIYNANETESSDSQTDPQNPDWPSLCPQSEAQNTAKEDKIPVPLSDILRFHKMASLCEAAENLRSVLLSAGYQLSSDGHKVLCDKLPESDDEEDSEEEYDNGYPGNDWQPVEEETWETDEEETGFVAKGYQLKNVANCFYICQICSQIMDRMKLSNKWKPSASRVLCTFCYGNHCLDCHRLKFSDTLSYEEPYAEWVPRSQTYHRGAIEGRFNRMGREVWDGLVPWSAHKFHLNNNEKSESEQDFTNLLSCKNEIDQFYLEWSF